MKERQRKSGRISKTLKRFLQLFIRKQNYFIFRQIVTNSIQIYPQNSNEQTKKKWKETLKL